MSLILGMSALLWMLPAAAEQQNAERNPATAAVRVAATATSKPRKEPVQRPKSAATHAPAPQYLDWQDVMR